MILLLEQPIRPGDFIRVGDAYGFIDDIGLRAARVVTRDQVTIIVPNSELVTTQVINSIPATNFRIAISAGVAYGSDTELVRQTLLAVAKEHPKVLAESEPEGRFESFGDSSLDFSLLVWISDPGEDRRVTSALASTSIGASATPGSRSPSTARPSSQP